MTEHAAMPLVFSGEVYCRCGVRLASDVDDEHVTVDGRQVRFRRSTDHLVCSSCYYSYTVAAVRAAVQMADEPRRYSAPDR